MDNKYCITKNPYECVDAMMYGYDVNFTDRLTFHNGKALSGVLNSLTFYEIAEILEKAKKAPYRFDFWVIVEAKEPQETEPEV